MNKKYEKLVSLLSPARISEQEKTRLQGVFSDDFIVYKVLRDLFYGFELSEEEKGIAKNYLPIKDLLRKIFLPEVKKDVNLFQTYDLWQTQDLKNPMPEMFEVYREAKWVMLKNLEAALRRIEDHNDDVDIEVKQDTTQGQLLARNAYIGYIDQQIRFIIQFVSMDSLSNEEIQKLMKANSSK